MNYRSTSPSHTKGRRNTDDSNANRRACTWSGSLWRPKALEHQSLSAKRLPLEGHRRDGGTSKPDTISARAVKLGGVVLRKAPAEFVLAWYERTLLLQVSDTKNTKTNRTSPAGRTRCVSQCAWGRNGRNGESGLWIFFQQLLLRQFVQLPGRDAIQAHLVAVHVRRTGGEARAAQEAAAWVECRCFHQRRSWDMFTVKIKRRIPPAKVQIASKFRTFFTQKPFRSFLGDQTDQNIPFPPHDPVPPALRFNKWICVERSPTVEMLNSL